MLDNFLSDGVEATDLGITATVGAWTFAFLSPGRDRDRLAELERAQVFCQLELDVTQGTIQALAFADEERRGLYRTLREISGIGRASAFAVLDAGELLDTLRAVAGKDTAYFKAVPGLGPKKVDAVIKALLKRYGGRLPQPVPVPVALLVEAREALYLHGLSAREAEERLLATVGDKVPRSSEDWMLRVG